MNNPRRIDRVATKVNLRKLWRHLKKDLASGAPGVTGLNRAIKIGWG